MRVRAIRSGAFCLALLFLSGSSAFADVTPFQLKSIDPTIPNWGPTTPSLSGQNPMVFGQFNPSLGQLQSVHVVMSFTTAEVVNMNFVTPSTIILRSSSAQSPNVG